MTVDAWERGLAGGAALLSGPPYVRQGWTELVRPANPAAGAGFTRKVPNDTWDRLLAVTYTLTTSAVGARRYPLLQFQDGDGTVFAQTPLGLNIQGSMTSTAFATQTGVPFQQPGDSRDITGSVTSPGALATIASLGLSGGTYQLNWQVEVDGTTAAGDDNNFQLSFTGLSTFPSENGHVPGQPYPQESLTIEAPAAGGSIVVQSILAGTVGAVYLAQVTAVPIGSSSFYGELPDLVMKSGWAHAITVLSEDPGDQLSGIAMLVERYPSSVAAGVAP